MKKIISSPSFIQNTPDTSLPGVRVVKYSAGIVFLISATLLWSEKPEALLALGVFLIILLRAATGCENPSPRTPSPKASISVLPPPPPFSFQRWPNSLPKALKPHLDTPTLGYLEHLRTLDVAHNIRSVGDVQHSILVLGETGIGKSAFVNWLNGTRYTRKGTDSLEWAGGSAPCVRSDDSSGSVTSTPILVPFKRRPGSIIVDCPGFGDTRGNDLEWAFHIDYIIKHLHPSLLVILANYNINRKSRLETTHFVQLLTGISTMISGDLKQLKHVQLVICKTETEKRKFKARSHKTARTALTEFTPEIEASTPIAAGILSELIKNKHVFVFDPTSDKAAEWDLPFSETALPLAFKLVDKESLEWFKLISNELKETVKKVKKAIADYKTKIEDVDSLIRTNRFKNLQTARTLMQKTKIAYTSASTEAIAKLDAEIEKARAKLAKQKEDAQTSIIVTSDYVDIATNWFTDPTGPKILFAHHDAKDIRMLYKTTDGKDLPEEEKVLAETCRRGTGFRVTYPYWPDSRSVALRYETLKTEYDADFKALIKNRIDQAKDMLEFLEKQKARPVYTDHEKAQKLRIALSRQYPEMAPELRYATTVEAVSRRTEAFFLAGRQRPSEEDVRLNQERYALTAEMTNLEKGQHHLVEKFIEDTKGFVDRI